MPNPNNPDEAECKVCFDNPVLWPVGGCRGCGGGLDLMQALSNVTGIPKQELVDRPPIPRQPQDDHLEDLAERRKEEREGNY